MKILRLTTLLDFGGQERKYISFTENPQLLQYDYEFAAIGFGGNAEKILKERGFKVHVLNCNFAIKNLSNIWAVYKLIKKVNPDVVHTAAAEANFHGIIAAKLAGVKYIIGEEIGIPNHSSVAKMVFRQVYKMATKVICVSKSVKNYLVDIKEIAPNKAVVVYNPVVVPTISRIENSFKFQIVYVGRLEKVKNVETLIRAIAGIQSENSTLTIVGEGRERESLENLTAELNVRDKVLFTGFSNNPSQYLASADLFVLPSYSEGFGIAAVEAMFLKIPVLATQIGGVPEFIQDGQSGWLFNPKDENELKSKLEMIQNLSDEERKIVATKGYDEVISKFTFEKYCDSLEIIYGNK